MSGIAGILRFDRQEVARRDLERMANALRAYGPDRTGISLLGSAGFVHVAMRMTPEDRFDSQPFRSANGSTITADVRLDNRDDILVMLGMAPSEASVLSDAQIVLLAWERFGDDAWSKLHGPFAVAIWNVSDGILTLARDHLGLNVVTWHRSDRVFAFATMPKGLFALPDIARELNQEKFADFLVLNHADHATTLYRDVFRVPPAHLAKIAPDGTMSLRRFWSTDDIKPVRLPSDQQYAEALLDRLDRSVRRQMRSIHPIASHLTGGLDSSSVSALAARALREKSQRLVCFTQVPRPGFDAPLATGSYADETPYVEAIRRFIDNIDPIYVQNDACDDFAELERAFLALDGPVRNPTTLGWTLEILRRARAQGRRVLLGGFFGNATISWSGWPQVAEHVRHGRLTTAIRQWRLFYRSTSHSRWSALRELIVKPLWPNATVGRSMRQRRRAPWQDHSAIRPDFAAAMGVEARARKVGHDFYYRSSRNERAQSLTPVDYLGDWLAAEKALTGVETRDPTADIDVVSFCFAVPPAQYLAEEVDRSLIRRAMWGLLPEAVLTNRLHGAHSADWHEKLSRNRSKLAMELSDLSRVDLARRAIDLARLERLLQRWPQNGWHTSPVENDYHFALTRGIAAARFLRWVETANR